MTTSPDTTDPLDGFGTVETVMHDLLPRTATVVETGRLSTNLHRLLFEITDADTFPFEPMGVDEHVKLFFPGPDGVVVMPEIGPRGIVRPEGGELPVHRDYTVRAFHRPSGRLTVDFVLHDAGVAGAWAQAARPGDRLGMLGPRGSHVYPAGYDWYLLAADESAVPAMSRWIEALPGGVPVIAVVEVAGTEAHVVLPEHDGLTVQILHRTSRPGDDHLLLDAVSALDFPDGTPFVWVAGEAETIKPVRRHLRRERGLDKRQMTVDGYWKAGTVNHDHHAVDEDD